MPEHLDPQDQRPDLWGPKPQIILIDPQDIRLELIADPWGNRLIDVNLRDSRGELLLQLDGVLDAADTIILTPAPRAA